MKEDIERKKQELEILRASFDKEKKQLNEKLETLKKKLLNVNKIENQRKCFQGINNYERNAFKEFEK